MKRIVCYILLLLVLTSCSEYQKIVKSTDPEYKYTKAIEYFENGKYVRAQTLFEDVSMYYKGTDRSQEVLKYMALCFQNNKDYLSGAEYFKAYIRNYPKGRYIQLARYGVGHCYYMDAPDARLSQETTKDAIKYLSDYLDLFPDGEYAFQASKELEEMYNKLARKEYLNAKLYYNLGTYLGNNYLSCIITAQNALKKYPGNRYQEELSWLICAAKYEELLHSVEEKKEDRRVDVEDECYNFLTEFPDSQYKKRVRQILDKVKSK